MGDYVTGQIAAVTAAAARFFVRLAACGWVPAYLASRGFGADTRRSWGIGYAPATRYGLTAHLHDLGFTVSAIEAAGLAKRSARGMLVDVFRDRIMFQVRAPDGAVAGFIGRAPPDADPSVPVYLNSPTTSLYRKSNLLFGLSEAHSALAVGAHPVLVEGPLDAIAITAAAPGRYAGIAPCGTALTPAQVRLLAQALPSPFTSPRDLRSPRGPRDPRDLRDSLDRRGVGVLIGFDADRAGRRAAVRAHRLLREITDDVTTVPLPAGADPAGYYREFGAAALARLLDSSEQPLADLVIDESVAKFDRWLDFTDGKFAALRATAPIIAGLPPSQVARQVTRLTARLGLTYPEVTEAVTTALERLVLGPDPPPQSSVCVEERDPTAKKAPKTMPFPPPDPESPR